MSSIVERVQFVWNKLNLTPYLLVAPPILIMVLLIVYPASLSILDSFTVRDLDAGTSIISLENYYDFFEVPIARQNLWYTISTTLVTVFLMFVVCFPISYYLRFSKGPVSNMVQVLALFPMFVPAIITSYALIRYLGERGWLDRILQSVTGWGGFPAPYPGTEASVIGLIWEGLPITVLILTAGLTQVSDGLIESARDVGANWFQVFFTIILPLMRRPVLIVLTLNFLSVFGAFTIPFVLVDAAPQMLGPYMARLYTSSQVSKVQVMAVVMFVISSAVGFLYVRAIVSEQREGGLTS